MVLYSKGIGNRKTFLVEVNLGYIKFYHIYGLKLLPDMLHLLTSNATESVAVIFNVSACM